MIYSLKMALKASLLALLTMLFFASYTVHAELVSIPALQTRVTDSTQTLSAEQKSQLEAKLTVFEQQKGSQIAVLIVPTTQPEDIAQFSIRVVDAWKLGRAKQDDGVLILVAKNDHKMRIEVGYGLEGAIPDLTAKRIISEIMSPSFKQGDFYGGLDHAVDKLIGLVNGEQLPAPVSHQSASNTVGSMLPFLLIGGLVVGSFLRQLLGGFFGGALTGSGIGVLAWLFGGGLLLAGLFGVIAFIVILFMKPSLGQIGGYSGGLGGGGFGGSSGSSDSFSGGGGGFGGGGASGDW